ncbi:tetratricopeptide repeat protein [Microbacterium luticocti]|uniref:tetratricopeptide repeat protein n=1 Tax=Microbacterium luticocti TaxID=451764 RepID=UPI00048D837F|nr:tetratricopeptide repeat protein [Microbacterium luticocti]
MRRPADDSSEADPLRAVTALPELIAALNALRERSGSPSFGEITRRIGVIRSRRGQSASGLPGRVTVYDAFRPDRRRVDVDLIADIAQALGADPRPWRDTCIALGPATGSGPTATVRTGLPEPVAVFTGRDEDLRTVLEGGPVVTIDGLAGIGKTELAVQAARALQHASAAGILFVNLHGYDAHRPAAAPGPVLGGLLRALGAPAEQVRALTTSDRAVLYRRLTRENPHIVVLDNAVDADQARPLLPDATASRAIVTSRRVLTELGATRVALTPMDASASAALLCATIGPERAAAEPDAVAELAAIVGGLPLGLVLTGALVAGRPEWSLTDHARRLRTLPQADAVDRALEASYARLDPVPQRVLRLLALHPGPNAGAADVAALAGLGEGEASAALATLAAENLILPGDGGTVRLHDLVRAFAWQRLHHEVPYSQQRVAMARLGERLRDRARDDALSGRSTPEADTTCTVGCAMWLADAGEHELAARIAASISRALDEQARSDEADALYTRVLGDAPAAARSVLLLNRSIARYNLGRYTESIADAAAVLTDANAKPVHRLNAQLTLGNVDKRTGRYGDALRHYTAALAEAAPLGDDAALASTLLSVADVHRVRGEVRLCLELGERGLEVATRCGNRFLQGAAHSNLGLLHARRGEAGPARAHIAAALEQARTDGVPDTECATLNAQGDLHRALGDWAAAEASDTAALQLARRTGNMPLVASALVGLAIARLRQGRVPEASADVAEALAVADAIGDREVRALVRMTQAALCGAVGAGGTPGDAPMRSELLAEAEQIAHALGDPYLLDLLADTRAGRGMFAPAG